MKLFPIMTTELNFLYCFAEEIVRFEIRPSVSVEDTLLFVVEDEIAGIAKIHTVINHETECKCHVSFEYAFTKEERPPYQEALRHITLSTDESQCQFESDEQTILSFFLYLQDRENQLGLFLTDLEHLIEQATVKDDIVRKKDIRRKNQLSFSHNFDNDMGDHQKAQYCLNEIANICELQTWTASNDKNRYVHHQRLGATDITSFPSLQTGTSSQQTIERIDTIWLKENRPVAAFEVETSTPIYSGLLRMADLATILSTSNLDLYIVAPKERAVKFVKEMKRPLFQQLQLDKMCYFIPIESLILLYQKIKGLDGYIDYQVLRIIRQSCKQLENLQR